MIFISAQPYDTYFQWQVEVQIVNFRKFDISKNMNVLVWHPKQAEMTERDNKTGKIVRKYMTTPDLSGWHKLQEKYPEVKIFFYEDEGVNLGLYIPQLRPQILKKHFAVNPFLEKGAVFYHDSDIIFNYLPDFESLLSDTINWQSNCSHYLDYKYLREKEIQGNIPEEEAIKILADIGNVSVETIKSYTGKTGGAQCILKMADADFWADIEKQVIEIRKAFFFGVEGSINKKYFPSEAAGFQSWCADMWALNMALWSRGKVTDVTPELDFSWATDTLETFQKKPIYHNAGATRQTPHLFHKGSWIEKSPIGKPIHSRADTASAEYVKAIQEVV
jgi:hypothetical protein